jgi:hypothetical protein
MKQMLRYAALLLLIISSSAAAHGQNTVRGTTADDAGKPLKGVAVSLLYPADSTLAFFGITDGDGQYLIQAVASGNYVLQASGMGYKTFYQALTVPVTAGALPSITLKQLSAVELEGVQVNAEKIPIMLKKDTIEYNAGSYKTKPDAAVEDLLKKLPGVEVDKAGNIKAAGKDVQKVLVDGKEFFGNDQKVATKNLPADAIDKVQVFDGLSQQAQYTGVDDGERERTINLMLKANKRKGYFGDLEAGGGTDDRFKLAAHYYRFKKTSQFAALGTLNNINQFGFTLQDYLSFSGGLNSLLNGDGGITLGANSPINFGQQVTGLITSGAAGLNYTYESKSGRYNISYIGNGADKKLDQQTTSQNYTDNNAFTRDEQLNERKKDFSHGLNYNIRQDLDSFQQMRFNGSASYSTGNTDHYAVSSSLIQSALLNNLDSRSENDANGLTANGTLSYTRRSKGNWPVMKLAAGAAVEKTFSENDWNNITTYFQPSQQVVTDNQYQRNEGMKQTYNAVFGITRKIGNRNFLEPEMRGSLGSDALQRHQGLAGNEHYIDSLSPQYERRYDYVRPGLTFRHSAEKLQYSFSLREELGWLTSQPANADAAVTQRSYLLPGAFWQYLPASSTVFNVSYNSSIAAPSAKQMLPVTDYSNPLQRLHGNPLLLPEYQHNAFLSFHRFDQFNFRSFMVSLNFRYVHDKINPVRHINADLSEDVSYANLPDDYRISGQAEYRTPIRKLGINITIGGNEQYTRGMNMVNDVLNINNTFTHGAKLGIGNRKKEHWDIDLTFTGSYTDSRYSVQQSLNSSFVQYGAEAQLSYRPNDHFYFSAGGNVDRYQSGSFPDAITVPLLQASVTYYFLKSLRGALTLEGFDLLDRNKAVQRFSQLNYLVEQRSNTIGRYFLLSFKYRLTTVGGNNGGGPMRIMMH